MIFDFDETLTLATFMPSDKRFEDLDWQPWDLEGEWSVEELLSYNFESPFHEGSRLKELKLMLQEPSSVRGVEVLPCSLDVRKSSIYIYDMFFSLLNIYIYKHYPHGESFRMGFRVVLACFLTTSTPLALYLGALYLLLPGHPLPLQPPHRRPQPAPARRPCGLFRGHLGAEPRPLALENGALAALRAPEGLARRLPEPSREKHGGMAPAGRERDEMRSL